MVMIFNAIFSNISVQLPVQSVPITIKCVSSNHAHGEVHSMQF